MKIDWMDASTEDRKVLYQVFKSILDNYALEAKEVYQQAYAGTVYKGIEYEDDKNFRAGCINKKRASLLYQWMCEHHPIYATRIVNAIHSEQPADHAYISHKCQNFDQKKASCLKKRYNVSFARVIGKDAYGKDIFARPREVGTVWSHNDDKEDAIINLDIIPTDLVNRNGVLLLIPVNDCDEDETK